MHVLTSWLLAPMNLEQLMQCWKLNLKLVLMDCTRSIVLKLFFYSRSVWFLMFMCPLVHTTVFLLNQFIRWKRSRVQVKIFLFLGRPFVCFIDWQSPNLESFKDHSLCKVSSSGGFIAPTALGGCLLWSGKWVTSQEGEVLVVSCKSRCIACMKWMGSSG